MKKLLTLSICLLLFSVISCSSPISIKKYVYDTKAPEETGDVTLSGTLVCLNCNFDPSTDAREFCKKYGHQHVLRAVDGRIYSIVKDEKTKQLIESDEYHGKAVTVTGRIIINSRAIKVTSYDLF